MEHRFNVAAWNNFDYSQGVFLFTDNSKVYRDTHNMFPYVKIYCVIYILPTMCLAFRIKNIDAIFHHKL